MKNRVAALALLLLASCRSEPPSMGVSSSNVDTTSSLTQEEAVLIASESSRDAMSIPKGITPVVEETDTVFIVTYPMTLPPGARGGDYYTKIAVDKNTGKITELLMAP